MSQLTFAEAEYENKKRKTRREVFLERMDELMPWKAMEKKIAKHYPKGENGRPPYPLLRISAYVWSAVLGCALIRATDLY